MLLWLSTSITPVISVAITRTVSVLSWIHQRIQSTWWQFSNWCVCWRQCTQYFLHYKEWPTGHPWALHWRPFTCKQLKSSERYSFNGLFVSQRTPLRVARSRNHSRLTLFPSSSKSIPCIYPKNITLLFSFPSKSAKIERLPLKYLYLQLESTLYSSLSRVSYFSIRMFKTVLHFNG